MTGASVNDERERLLARIAEAYVIDRASDDRWLITGDMNGVPLGPILFELPNAAFASYLSWVVRTTDDNDVAAAIETVFIHVDEAIQSGLAMSQPVVALGVKPRHLRRGEWFVQVD